MHEFQQAAERQTAINTAEADASSHKLTLDQSMSCAKQNPSKAMQTHTCAHTHTHTHTRLEEFEVRLGQVDLDRQVWEGLANKNSVCGEALQSRPPRATQANVLLEAAPPNERPFAQGMSWARVGAKENTNQKK